MKAKIGLFLFTMLTWVGMGFAGPADGPAAGPGAEAKTPVTYFNLTASQSTVMWGSPATTILTLRQENKKCTPVASMMPAMGAGMMWNGCIASVEAAPDSLAKMLETNWVKSPNFKGVTLELGSNIDLAEYSSTTEEGKCDVNHVPFPAVDSTSFNGNNFTISNLCYVVSEMKGPVGLFESINRMTVQRVKLDGVRIIIDGKSHKGKDYHPVGALAGVVSFSLIDSISIANETIQAPIAGGIAGYVKNATLSNISGDGIYVSNSVLISDGYAGFVKIAQETGYNVFLGGLAGVVVRDTSEGDQTFVNDSLKVDVSDKAQGHKSALGGIVGYYKSVGNTNENLRVVKKVGDKGEVLPSRISGGSSMGGLFGVLSVYRETKGLEAGNTGKFVLRNSTFDGKIYDASSPTPGVMAVGGLVGFDSTASRASLQISESYSAIDLSDSLKIPGIYQYYAGGIIGYGGSCKGGTGDAKEFLSVRNSKTEGAIALSASASAVEDLRSDAYLGGIVGSACFAQAKDMGLANDTSSVKITSKVKTAVNDEKKDNGAPARDSVYVGGVVGFASVAVANNPAMISGIYYDGSIAVEDSLNNVFVGGILGGFNHPEGGKTLSFENVIARNENLISYRAKEGAKLSSVKEQVTNVGGLCGICDDITRMNKVGASGNIYVGGSYSGNSLLVGGLVGSSSANVVKMELHNAFSIGDISVTANNGNAGATFEKKVGYLFGKIVLNKGYDIKSVYHYDENETDLTTPFGQLGNTSTVWTEDADIHYVVRNAAENVVEDSYSGDHNGIVKSLKNSKFAGFLNSAYADEKEYAWSYVKGLNSDLPIFADGKNPAIKPEVDASYVVVFVDMNKETIKQETVKLGESATAPTDEEMEEHQIEGYTFTGEWDKSFVNVKADLTVTAEYAINIYTVRFFNYDGTVQIGSDKKVKYKESADPPTTIPSREGYEFAGWDDLSYAQVKSDLNIKATYVPKKYQVVFQNYDGYVFRQELVNYDAVVLVPTGIVREATAEYEYTFVGWTPEVTKVKGNAVYTATYDSTKVLYKVSFYDYDDTPIGDAQFVEYGSSAVAPADPVRKGYTFAGWDRNFDKITKAVDVKATYEKNSGSSSSVVPKSSSSVGGKLKIVKPKIEQSGNAILLTFDTENADESAVAHVEVIGENGPIVDTDIPNSVVNGGQWEMTPAPIGKFEVTLTVGNEVQSAEYRDYFEVASEITAAPGSWQMVSLSAFDKRSYKTDDATLYWWDEQSPVGDYWQYRAFAGENADATRGFWYGTTDGKPLVIRESTGSKDSEIEWDLDSLFSGWNLVANPYGWYVDLSKGTTSDDAKVSFWRWNPTTAEYEVPKVLGPYEAVWAKVSKKTTWRMSAAPVFNIQEKTIVEPDKKALHKETADVKGAWNMKVALTDEFGKKDSWNVIGAGTEESLDEPPTGMGNRVSLAIREVFADGKKGAKLAKSIKAVADEYRWILDVSASSARDGKLTFDGVAELNKQGLKLFVESDGEVKELRDGQAYDIALAKSAKQVEVRVAASNAVVASSKISGFGSTLAGGSLQLGFTAPDNLAGANASYAVVGVDGKKVATGSFKAAAGMNQFSLKAPKTGVYFVKIKVGSQQLSGKVLVR